MYKIIQLSGDEDYVAAIPISHDDGNKSYVASAPVSDIRTGLFGRPYFTFCGSYPTYRIGEFTDVWTPYTWPPSVMETGYRGGAAHA